MKPRHRARIDESWFPRKVVFSDFLLRAKVPGVVLFGDTRTNSGTRSFETQALPTGNVPSTSEPETSIRPERSQTTSEKGSSQST